MTHDKQTIYDFDIFFWKIMESCIKKRKVDKNLNTKLELVSMVNYKNSTSTHDYTELLEK